MRLFSQNIDKLNYYATWLHGMSFLVILVIFLTNRKEVNFNTDLFRTEIKELTDGDKTVVLEVKKVSTISTDQLKAFVLFTFLFTALVHYFYYTNGFGSGVYKDQLKRSQNSIRWLEYAITSTVMIFVLCIISGVKEADTVTLITLINAALMGLGYFVETSPTKKGKIIALLMGFYILGTLWYTILYNFYSRINEVQKVDHPTIPGKKREVPSWVKQVLMPMFFWYLSFGIVALFYVKNYNKPGFKFETYERFYIILSYLSKAFMGYYLAFGLTRPKADDLNEQ